MLGGNINSYMSQSVIKNCNVKIYPITASSSYFLDKTRIVSLRMERTNNGVLDVAPTDSLVFEIINWSTINQTYKNMMTTRGTYLKVGFTVENTDTQYKIVECVKDCTVDRRQNKATLTLCSPFEFMTGNNFVEEVMWDVWDLTNNREITGQNFHSFPLRSETTFFEGVQYHAISKGKGAVIKNVTYSQTYPPAHTPQTFPPYNQADYFELKSLTSTTTDLTLDEINITSEIKESLDDNDRSEIVVYGLKEGTEEWLMSSEAVVYTSDPYQFTFNIAEKVGKPIVVTHLYVWGHNGQPQVMDKFYFRVSNNSVFFYLKNPNDPPPEKGTYYVFNVYGYIAEPVDKTVALDDNTKPYISIPTFLHDSEYIGAIQSTLRSFYSHKTYIDFDCRFDPRIEPMDVIYISGVGKIKVEKVSMAFNGAFSGHVRGRLIVSE